MEPKPTSSGKLAANVESDIMKTRFKFPETPEEIMEVSEEESEPSHEVMISYDEYLRVYEGIVVPEEDVLVQPVNFVMDDEEVLVQDEEVPMQDEEVPVPDEEAMLPYLLNLPAEVLEIVMKNLPYAKVAEFRRVNSRWNTMCSRVLVDGYVEVCDATRKFRRRVNLLLPSKLMEACEHHLWPFLQMSEALEEAILTLNIAYLRGGLTEVYPAGKVLDLAEATQRLIELSPDDHEETIAVLDLTRAAAMKARVHCEKHWPFVPKPPPPPEPPKEEEVDEIEVAYLECQANISSLQETLAAMDVKFKKLYEIIEERITKEERIGRRCVADFYFKSYL